MKAIAIILSLILTVTVLGCDSDEYQLRIEKKTLLYASEESYKVYHGTSLLAVSSAFTNNAVRNYYHCIPIYSDGVYKLQMLDSAKDAWSAGAYIRLLGPNGQLVYIGIMTEKEKQEIEFSLQYPIAEKDTWKLSSGSTPSSSWTLAGFNDNTWSSFTGGSSQSIKGTIYVRKTFTGLSKMAAYELTFYYQYGIIVYVGGKEVFRDHMPTTTPNANTLSTDRFDSLEHHSVIRNGLEIEATTNVVAMEFHYDDISVSHTFTVTSFLAPYLPSVGDSCYLSHEAYSVTSSSQQAVTDVNGPGSVFDLNIATSWIEETYYYWVEIMWENWIPQINAFAINTYYNRGLHPTNFNILTGKTASGSLSTLIQKTDVEYENNLWNYFTIATNDAIYKRLRFQVTKTGGTSLRFNELALLTCRYAAPESISYPESSYTGVASVTTFKIAPAEDGFTQCTVSPTFPTGLSINYNSCIISGTPREVVTNKEYTITSNKPASSTKITLTLTECDKSIIEIRRVYGAEGFIYETHSLRKSTDGTIIERVAANTNQKGGATVITRYCIDPGLYELSLDNTVASNWSVDSYITVGFVTGTEITNVIKWKYDLAGGYSPSVTINLNREIPREADWGYVMGSLPEGWDSADPPASWPTAKKGSFPVSTNQFQVYKRSFSVEDDPAGSSYELELRFTYGAIVMVNGIEVYRKNIQGAVTNETYATSSYPSLLYRKISLPVQTITQGEVQGRTIIQKGTNVIAVLLVSALATQTTSNFDLSLHINGRLAIARLLDITATASDTSVDPKYLVDGSSKTVYVSSSCSTDRFLQFTFTNDRREWISRYSIVSSTEENKQAPTRWVFQAKNDEDAEWTTLDTYTQSISWWYTGQIHNFYVSNNKPYNSYRFNAVYGKDDTNCEINIVEIGLYSDSLWRNNPELDYNGNTHGYLYVDFADLTPNGDYYSHFTSEPALPTFLSLDYASGVIRGENVQLLTETSYVITAKKLDGTDAQKTLALSITSCDKVMITLTVRTDSYPSECGWTLYKGAGTTEVVQTKEQLEYKNSYEYTYFCIDQGVYTIEARDTYGDGWYAPSGFYIRSFNGDALIYSAVPRSTEKPGKVTITFSTYTPIAMGSTEWRFLKNNAPSNWNSASFDDTVWNKITGGESGTYEKTTNYFRMAITLSDIVSYPVLNVVVYYSGGCIAYFNGNRVYRKNLPSDTVFDTLGTDNHYGSSRFSIPIQRMGGINGKNVLAFELHMAKTESTTSSNNFDAGAILSMGSCAPIRFTTSNIKTSVAPVSGSTYGLFDNSVMNYISWDWADGLNTEWSFDNLEGTYFNKYRIYGDGSNGAVYWTMFGRKSEVSEVYYTVKSENGETIPDRKYFEGSSPAGLLGYNEMKLTIDRIDVPTGFTIDEIEFLYCPWTKSSTCPGVGTFPTVGEGELSVGECPEFYDGYATRLCENGRLQNPDNSHCMKFPPQSISFDQEMYDLFVNAKYTIKPNVFGLVDDYQIDPLLPNGLSLDAKTGIISGMPTEKMTTITAYVLTGYNEMGSVSGTMKITIKEGFCDPIDVWGRASIGETLTYDCKEQGNYYGSMTRKCQMGKELPEWGPAIGVCVSQNTFYGLGIILVVVIMVIIVVVIKVSNDKKKVKARSGVRGGKRNMNVMKNVPYGKL